MDSSKFEKVQVTFFVTNMFYDIFFSYLIQEYVNVDKIFLVWIKSSYLMKMINKICFLFTFWTFERTWKCLTNSDLAQRMNKYLSLKRCY